MSVTLKTSPTILTNQQAEFHSLSKKESSTASWICLSSVFNIIPTSELAALAQEPNDQQHDDQKLSAFKAQLVVDVLLEDHKGFDWLTKDESWTPSFAKVLYESGLQHLKTCLRRALPNHREALYQGNSIETHRLIQEGVEQDPGCNSTDFSQHIFQLSGLMHAGCTFPVPTLRRLTEFHKIIANPSIADAASTFSQRDRLFFALSCLFQINGGGEAADYTYIQGILKNSYEISTFFSLITLKEQCKKRKLTTADFSTTSPLMVALRTLYSRCGRTEFFQILCNLHLIMEEAQKQPRPRPNHEQILYKNIWESNRYLIYAFDPILSASPTYIRASDLIIAAFKQNPAAKLTDILSMLCAKLSKKPISHLYCYQLFQTWWFRYYPEERPYGLSERLCDWHAFLIRTALPEITLADFIVKMEKIFHHSHSPLPFYPEGARRAYERMIAPFAGHAKA